LVKYDSRIWLAFLQGQFSEAALPKLYVPSIDSI